jgi:hypothetical protein
VAAPLRLPIAAADQRIGRERRRLRWNAYSRTWADAITGDFSQVVGRPARNIDDFVRDFAAAFGKR